MNFTITEDELNVIDSTRGQLNLVAGLLIARDSDPGQYNASDLCAFLSAQVDSLKALLEATTARNDAARNADNVLTNYEWKEIIETIGGRGHLRWGDIKKLTLKMQRNVLIDSSMKYVFDAWMNIIHDDGAFPFSLEPSSTDGFGAKFDVRVPVIPAAAPVAAKKATRKREKLATAAAAS